MKPQRKQQQQRAHHGLVGRLDDTPAVSPPSHPRAGRQQTESEMRAKFGLAVPVTPPPSAAFAAMRQTLMLSPEDLIALFDETPATKVGEREVFAEMDFLVPVEMLRHRIERLKTLIAASKAIIEGLLKRIMKLRRAKDDILDKATQEKYKREETARVVRSNAKLFKYRAALRNANYREKIWRYQMQPVYFRDLVDDVMTFEEFGPAYYANDKFKTPSNGGDYWTTNLVRRVKTRLFDVSRYEVMMQLDQSTLRVRQRSGSQEII